MDHRASFDTNQNDLAQHTLLVAWVHKFRQVYTFGYVRENRLLFVLFLFFCDRSPQVSVPTSQSIFAQLIPSIDLLQSFQGFLSRAWGPSHPDSMLLAEL